MILLFYPGDNTAVCTKQFCSYRNAEAFGALDATVVGISAQGVASHRDFATSTDSRAAAGRQEWPGGQELRRPRSVVGTKRAVIIVDEEGIVRHRHDHLFGLDFQTVGDLREALDSLPSRAS